MTLENDENIDVKPEKNSDSAGDEGGNKGLPVNALRWCARIGGTLLFIFFLKQGRIEIGHLASGQPFYADIFSVTFLLMLAALIIAWIWEGAGGAILIVSWIFLVLLMGFVPKNDIGINGISNWFGPFLLVGIAYYVCWWLTRKGITRI